MHDDEDGYMFCEQSSIRQESAGRVRIQSLNVDHKHVLLISHSWSYFILRTFHILPCCKLVHSIISNLSILYVLSNLLVLSFNPLSCPASCHSPNIFTPQYHARVQNFALPVWTMKTKRATAQHNEWNMAGSARWYQSICCVAGGRGRGSDSKCAKKIYVKFTISIFHKPVDISQYVAP